MVHATSPSDQPRSGQLGSEPFGVCSCGDFCGEDPACALHGKRKLTAGEYERAAARIEWIFDAEPGTAEYVELDAITDLAEAYEKEHFPIDDRDDDRQLCLSDCGCYARDARRNGL